MIGGKITENKRDAASTVTLFNNNKEQENAREKYISVP